MNFLKLCFEDITLLSLGKNQKRKCTNEHQHTARNEVIEIMEVEVWEKGKCCGNKKKIISISSLCQQNTFQFFVYIKLWMY